MRVGEEGEGRGGRLMGRRKGILDNQFIEISSFSGRCAIQERGGITVEGGGRHSEDEISIEEAG